MTIHEFAQLWFDKWRSAVEILLLSVVIYYGYLYFRGTRGAKVLTGMAIVFLTLTLISQLLNLVVISFILLAVTGVAGPTEQDGIPVGTVCFGIALPGKPTETISFRLPGDRERIRQFATISLLNLLRQRLDAL